MRRYLGALLIALAALFTFTAVSAAPATAATAVNHSHQCKSTGFHSGYQGIVCFDFYSTAVSGGAQLLRVDAEGFCGPSGGYVQCKSALVNWTAKWQANPYPLSYGPSTGRCVPGTQACKTPRNYFTGDDDNQPIHNGYCGVWSATLTSAGFTFPNGVQASLSNWTVSTNYCTGS